MKKNTVTIDLSEILTNKRGARLWKKSIGKLVVLSCDGFEKFLTIVQVEKKMVTFSVFGDRRYVYSISQKNLNAGKVDELFMEIYDSEVKECNNGFTDLNFVPHRISDGKYDWVSMIGEKIPYEYDGKKGVFTIKKREGSILVLESNGVTRNCYETEVGRGQLTRFYKKVASAAQS